MNNVIDKITVKVFNNFTKTSSGFNILIAQTIVILFFLWKFNSRDFSFSHMGLNHIILLKFIKYIIISKYLVLSFYKI